MRRLLIDAGNTRIKLAVVEDGCWQAVTSLPTHQPGALTGYLSACDDVRQVWVSNVAGATVEQSLRQACAARHWAPQFIRAQASQCGVHNGYVQPSQLGSDRWAALIAAWHLLGAASLVVNSGTATTIDALSDRGGFLGGLILPGIALMRSSLATGTAQLPATCGDYASFPGNTADALASGAIQATCGAIQRQHALLAVADAPVLLSGGAAQVLQPHINLPLRMMDNLVLQGLLLIAQETSEA